MANFIIAHAMAYTREKILVHTLYVCNIRQKTSNEELFKYFQNFGSVSNVSFILQRKKGAVKQAFATFDDAKDAAKALQCTYHSLNGKPLYVYAGDSWHQPEDKQFSLEDETSSQIHKAFYIDIIMLKIFSFLDISSRVNITGTYSHLEETFKVLARRQYKTLKLESIAELTVWQSYKFFQYGGSKIRSLEGTVPSGQVLNFIGKYCHNIERIDLNDSFANNKVSILTTYSLQKLLKNLHAVTELTLMNTFLTDECILPICNLKNLKILSLASNYCLSGRYMKNLSNIENLSLNNCKGLQSKFFVEICQNLIGLRALDLENCLHLYTTDLIIMVEHLQILETLRLTCHDIDIECIAELPNLKNLTLISNVYISNSIFPALANKLQYQLEKLEIKADVIFTFENVWTLSNLVNLHTLECPKRLDDICLVQLAELKHLSELSVRNNIYITDEGILELLSKCPSIRSLNVFGCRRLTKHFAEKVFTQMKSDCKKNNTKRNLKIIASFAFCSYFNLHTNDSSASLVLEFIYC